jgi:hypothetical protein
VLGRARRDAERVRVRVAELERLLRETRTALERRQQMVAQATDAHETAQAARLDAETRRRALEE